MIPRECKRLFKVNFPIAEVSRHAGVENPDRKRGHLVKPRDCKNELESARTKGQSRPRAVVGINRAETSRLSRDHAAGALLAATQPATYRTARLVLGCVTGGETLLFPPRFRAVVIAAKIQCHGIRLGQVGSFPKGFDVAVGFASVTVDLLRGGTATKLSSPMPRTLRGSVPGARIPEFFLPGLCAPNCC